MCWPQRLNCCAGSCWRYCCLPSDVHGPRFAQVGSPHEVQGGGQLLAWSEPGARLLYACRECPR